MPLESRRHPEPAMVVDLLGRSVALSIVRFGPPGAFLAIPGEPRDTILLPGADVPEAAQEGDELLVFVYLDGLGRPIATTRPPKLELGEVAFLEVTGMTSFGAFVDWGPGKELLVPLAEQTWDIRVGDRVPIGLIVDKSGRLAGTMRVTEMLARPAPGIARGDRVRGEAWRNDPEIGLFVIVARSCVGLVPASEPHALGRGEAAEFRVSHVLPDGKIELSLREPAHEAMESDAAHVLKILRRPETPRVGDHSSPELVRTTFGLSKKAFKRAVGRLLKEGAIRIDGAGFVVPSG